MNNSVEKAVQILQEEGVILTPTDTTFGLSCLTSSKKAIDKIFEIKQRPKNKSFILLVDNSARLERVVKVPDLAWDIIDLSEKPVTIIYDKVLDLPAHALAPDGTVGIRLVKDPMLVKIIQRIKQPLVSTSVNLSGASTPQRFEEIDADLLKKVDYILPEAEHFIPNFLGSSIIKLNMDGQVKVIRA